MAIGQKFYPCKWKLLRGFPPIHSTGQRREWLPGLSLVLERKGFGEIP